MNTASDGENLGGSTGTGDSRLQRLLIACFGFIAFEVLFIWILGEKIYDFGYFSPGMWGLLALAGAGYLGLGYFSRSWLSGLVLMVPLLVALYFVNVVWTIEFADGTSVGVNASFAEIWLNLSLLFVPAWAAGVLMARKRLT